MNTKEALANVQRTIQALADENYALKEEIVSLTMQRDRLLVGQQKDDPKEKKRGQTYAIGQRFRSQYEDGSYGEEIYLLAQTSAGEVNLIGLTRGNRWSEPLQVENGGKVPKWAFDKAFESRNAPRWVIVS